MLNTTLSERLGQTPPAAPWLVALCGLTPRDQRMVEIVMTRSTVAGVSFAPYVGQRNRVCNIALVDHESPHGLELFSRLRRLHPGIAWISLSTNGQQGATRLRITRSRLLRDFSITLALAVASAAPQPRMPMYVSRPPVRETSHALVVDDSMAMQRQMADALASAGIVAVSAMSAEDGARALRSGEFDVVFLDVVLPGIDGYEFCRKLKHDPYTKHVPVVLLTGRGSVFDQARGRLAGCDAYLTKPLDLTQWRAVLHRVLKARSPRLLARGLR
jgi:twitching motility two-component system response regulator PilG